MDFETGLTAKEVSKNKQKYGLNLLESNHKLKWQSLLLDQFKSPLIYILFGAGLISVFLKDWTDAIVIFIAVGVNSGLGFWQEFKAEKSLEALKNLIVPHAMVIRNKIRMVIEAKNIVPGDVVVLKMGDKIPADGVVVEATDLYVNEAILTGESEAINKGVGRKKKNVVYMGTTVSGGKGLILVTNIGMRTRMGGLADQLGRIENEETPLKQRVAQMAKFLTIVVGGICVLIFVEGLVVGRDVWEMLKVSVAVAVAAIPEGLVVSVTVILTLGMQRILKEKGLVRKLLAAETLGSVDVICIDKTGTLTEGKMKIVGDNLKFRKEVMRDLMYCNPMINSVDKALEDWGVEGLGLVKKKECSEIKIDEIPFNSTNKWTGVMCKKNEDEGLIYIYGAPEKVLTWCMADDKKEEQRKKFDELTEGGLRIIGVARMEGNLDSLGKKFAGLKRVARNREEFDRRKLTFEWLGLVHLDDSVRKDVKGALQMAKRAGIQIKVITGDYENTAIKVMEELGLVKGARKENIMWGEEMRSLADTELLEKIEGIVLFHRTTPEQKIRIVTALQEKGHVVAMMGDGVNDALALKKADIGVVVNEATEVAKETADMVLLDSNFSTIVTAVKEGRKIFENIRKVILYLISGSFSEVILVIGALLMRLPIPFLAVQILWINIVEDSLPALALAFEKDGANVMKQRPRPKGMPIINKRMKLMMGIIIATTDLILFLVYSFLIKTGVGIELSRTIIFAILGIDSLLFVFSCKNLYKNIWEINVFSNKYLNGSVVVGMGLLLAGIYVPVISSMLGTVAIPAGIWWWIVILAVLDLAIIEILKLGLRIKKREK
ncbi:cation-transporting P-type ATPase [Patescibacteria group bacterium]|nr:cation-transporting P-type ATPase [Patescibacteria group bacterium]